jgi:hypothetical protein
MDSITIKMIAPLQTEVNWSLESMMHAVNSRWLGGCE